MPPLSVETKLDFAFTILLASKSKELPVQRLGAISALDFVNGSKLEGNMASLLTTVSIKCRFLRGKGNKARKSKWLVFHVIAE